MKTIKFAAVPAMVLVLAGCSSSFGYFHDRTKPPETVRSDYLECGRIAFVQKSNVHMPLKPNQAAVSDSSTSAATATPPTNNAAAGFATGFASGFAEGWNEAERKKQNMIKCMALRGYAMYHAGGSTNSEFQALPREKKMDRRVELGGLENPVGEFVAYPPEWDLGAE
ncbi:hypothetical protein EOI86_06410 [Hwanghaeella grinnelliae]|uniref:Lipoprotein n=1 Tax=Hwanghaeella grinnelliae TaxID=2500179 RepID=A0A3S2Z9Y6_9PROT|nr:hypothetical protein [Hwanghaeella grinnelliae]RVU38895.1 hypothetical protein EOI86_06410 [Hwanghaeella grinnelliae]